MESPAEGDPVRYGGAFSVGGPEGFGGDRYAVYAPPDEDDDGLGSGL